VSRRLENHPERILVVRNDKLGDFVLALPVFELLKRHWPEAELVALVPEYTRAVAELSPFIDRDIIDPGPETRGSELGRRLRSEHFDAAVTLFSTTRIGLALRAARIPCRIAPATKLAQFLHNYRVRQRRSESTQPEYEYNLDLARELLRMHGAGGDMDIRRPVLAFEPAEVAERRGALLREHELGDTRLVILHSGHGGSANNLSLEQYAALANALHSETGHAIVLTAGPGEEEQAQKLAERIDAAPTVVHRSVDGLRAFTLLLATADLFVGGSTGPLHLAGALDRPTLAFYPRRATSSPLRWQTLNRDERRIAFCPVEPAGERDLSAVDTLEAARAASAAFLRC